MSSYPLFQLGGRLRLCASMVRAGCSLADIGTDHAYLPIWLAKQGLISRAVAADVRTGPLQKAKQNIERYQVENIVTARLSDGLDAILPSEAEDVVIAGMGGETMVQILTRALWLKDANRHLILQPMTTVESLRAYLADEGFAVTKEQAVQQEGHVYSAFLAVYEPNLVCTDELYLSIGRLKADTPDNCLYIQNRAAHLEKRANGLALSGKQEEAESLRRTIEKLKAMLEKGDLY